MDTIFSKYNEKVKFIKSLNEKKSRQEHNAFYIEGIKVVDEILNKKEAIDIMFIAYSNQLLLNANGGKELLEKFENDYKNIERVDIDANIFKSLTDTKTPQGVLAVINKQDKDILSLNFESDVLILDKIQDSRKYWNNN